MQIHQLKPNHKIRKKNRVGRGGKRGTYSGRGQKGQKARAGAKIRPPEREWLSKIPKLRGYKFRSLKIKPAIVNIELINNEFNAGDIVSPKTLYVKGLIHKVKGRLPSVKILGGGKLDKKVIIKDCLVSKSAEKALKSR